MPRNESLQLKSARSKEDIAVKWLQSTQPWITGEPLGWLIACN